MTLKDQLVADGRVLFRRRSWLPLMILGVAPIVVFGGKGAMLGETAEGLWTMGCVIVALVGQGLRFVTIAHVPSRTSGRNRKEQVADALNTEGMYSIVRNPLYLGNCLTWLGLAAVPHAVWPWVSVALIFWLYHERVILAEESFLEAKFGETFREWARRTPVFFPNVRLWRSPPLSFSFRTAIGREYVNVFAVMTAFTAFDALADSAAVRSVHIDTGWAMTWGVALGLFVVLRILKKRTQLFRVEGRDWYGGLRFRAEGCHGLGRRGCRYDQERSSADT